MQTATRIGFSYLRYSSMAQSDGDSIRRQTAATQDWCQKNGVVLDGSRSYQDHGVSAFHGRHRQQGGALAAFLRDVESGAIPRGSALIIENLDRLTRESPWDAVPLLCGLVNAGITVVTLNPTEMKFERGNDLTSLVLAVIEFGRANSESASKSNRLSEAWSEKRRQAREAGTVYTRHLPAWIECRDKKLVLNPERALQVRRFFDLAIQGYGLALIVRQLTAEGVPTWGRSKSWLKCYLHKILSNRAVLGEFQPTQNGKPDGEVIPDYFPAVIDESTWLQAQAALARRKSKPGPVGEKVATLFGGMLRDALTQDRMVIAHQHRGWKKRGDRSLGRISKRVLVSAKSMEGATPSRSFPHEVFESAILSMLKEIRPEEVIGPTAQCESTTVAAELAAKEQRMRMIEGELSGDGDDIPALVRVLKTLTGECDELRKRLAVLRQEESNPQSVAWAETQSLIDVAQTESQRLRLRELIRTVIEEIWVLIVPRKTQRVAAVQVYFRGAGRRDYLIHNRSAGYCRTGGWAACSLPSPVAAGNLDLRRKEDAADLAKALESVDLDKLAEAMQEKGKGR